jgi:glyoxylase-like metal-dependent hydrolase (beta-lactamase superfamily II)
MRDTLGPVIAVRDVCRLDLGYFVRPAEETGTGQPRAEPVLAYLLRLPDGLLLFASGMGVGPFDLEEHYRPVRNDLGGALRALGVSTEDVHWVVNSHLHFDHCGGNRLFAGRPIIVQQTELEAARVIDYTLPHLIDFPDAHYDAVDGEAEIFPGVRIVPTPGHTEGHQSLLVRCRDGTVIVAGQAHDFATGFAGDVLAWRAQQDSIAEPLPFRPWVPRLLAEDPARVLFAHDSAVWQPNHGPGAKDAAAG